MHSTESRILRDLNVEPSPAPVDPSPPARVAVPPDGTDARDDRNIDRAASAHQSVVINVAPSRSTSTEQLAKRLRQYSEGNARLIVKYYTHAHRQASISFMLSIAFAVIGFAIFGAAAVSYLRDPDQVGVAIIATVAGAVNEAVGFLFFQRADKTRDLMVTMIDRLRADREADRQFVSALGVIDQVENPAIQDSVRAAIATQYAGCSSTALADIASLAGSKAFAHTREDT